MLVMVRSARTLRSMAALVSVVVERRARVHASGWAAGVGELPVNLYTETAG